MSRRYQDIYPSDPLLRSTDIARPSAASLLTLEYFEAEPAVMETDVFAQHHVLINLKDEPHRVENWRDGEHRDFIFHKNEIVVTPAGMRSGWRWHARSRVIVVTLEPEALERFAQSEVGVVLTGAQLQDRPQFEDRDICQAAVMVRDALSAGGVGAELMFESLARVFLIKLIQRYADRSEEAVRFSTAFTATHYKRVLDHVASNFGATITLEALAGEAGLSPAHFSRVFKEVIGKSPTRFVTDYRIEQARRMLRQGDRPMIDIALACGFSDQAHFSRVFKQVEGVTPKAFRKVASA